MWTKTAVLEERRSQEMKICWPSIISHNGMVWRDKLSMETLLILLTYYIKVIILISTLCFRHFKFLISLSKVMDQDGELNHLRLQFQALQQQQEKRKLDRKKEREANKAIPSVTRDNIDVCQTDKHNDRWVLMKAKIND